MSLLTRGKFCGKIGMLFTTMQGRHLTAKELLFWHNRVRAL